MDIRFTSEQEAFRKRVGDFLSDALAQVKGEPRPRGTARWSPAFSRLMAEAGLLCVSWPEAYGGSGLGFVEQMILNQELALANAPTEFHRRAVYYAGPVLIRHGTNAQRERFLPAISRAEMSFCQLFSEPEAGSDLASLKTTAIRSGSRFIVNGQKIWTSGAHLCEYGILLARTAPDLPRHRGISMFFIPMRSAGISVQPLVNMAGEKSFNQVFFDNVELDELFLIGSENNGWAQSRSLLEFERSSLAANSTTRRSLTNIVAEFRSRWQSPMPGYTQIRADIAEAWIRLEVGTMLSYRTISAQQRDEPAGHLASLAKLFAAELARDVAVLGVRVAGLAGQVSPQTGNGKDWQRNLLSSVAQTIGGGTSEIQRTSIAQRLIGLPRA